MRHIEQFHEIERFHECEPAGMRKGSILVVADLGVYRSMGKRARHEPIAGIG
jgi:hypothetical protein